MGNPKNVRELVGKSLVIPTLPDVIVQLQRLVEDSSAGTREAGALIARDAPLAAKTLQLANSAYYGLAGRCVSTEHACTVLGMRVLRNIALQASILSIFEHVEGDAGFDVKRLWDHASRTAQLCSRMAEAAGKRKGVTPSEYYVCGLLHDIGKIVMLDGLGAEYAGVLRDAQRARDSICAKERERFGFDHTQAGVCVARAWSLPDNVGRAIEQHHKVLDRGTRDPLVACVAVANLLEGCATEEERRRARAALKELAAPALELGDQAVESIYEFACTPETPLWEDDPW